MAEHQFNADLTAAKIRLVDALNSFKNSLVPRLYVENLIKSGEKQIGLSFETAEKPVFARNHDPQLITASTNARLRQLYSEKAGLQPILQVSFGVDGYHVWSWFGPQLAHLNEDVRQLIEAAAAIYVADMVYEQPVMEERPDALAGLYKNRRIARKLSGSNADAMQNILYNYISDFSYVPNKPGICFQMGSSGFDSRYLYCYQRKIGEYSYLYGGYLVIFASADLKVANIVKDVLKATDPGISRGFYDKSPYPVNCLIQSQNDLKLVSNVPTELVGFNLTTSENYPLPRYLSVSLSIKDLKHNYQQKLQRIATIARLTVAAVFMLSVYFVLFGMPRFMRLRLRVLVILALVLLMPYVLLGYFCFSLLESSQNLAKYELKAESDNMLYRTRKYFFDQRLQFALHSLKSKDRLTHLMSLPAEEINNMASEKVVNVGSRIDLAFVRNDGVSRYFRDPDESRNALPRVDEMMSVKYLNNLGVMSKDTPRVKKLLDQIVLADGFMDNMRQDYYEHSIMQHEAAETADLRKIDNFSSMIFYLIPAAEDPTLAVAAFAMASVANSGNMLVNPAEFSGQVYAETTQSARHNFALGMRRVDDSILCWWPEHISHGAPLRQLLDRAISARSSGSRADYRGEGGRVEQYYFENDLPVVISVISQGFPDFFMQLLVGIFPLALLVVVLLSLFLFADILTVLFIVPVKGFQKAASQIGDGNWQVRVEIPDNDEFSLLAASFNRMALGLEQREKMRRFVSEDLYNQLGQQKLNEEPRLARASLLASDIRGFTRLSEKTDPQHIVSLLNDYFTEMESAITSCGGHIERLVGDAVVAVFYDSDEGACEQRATLAAWRMRARLARLNQQRQAANLFTIDNGIGIATGNVFSGMAGPQTGRRIFSVIGGVPQKAEKIESLTRTVDSRILLCPDTVARLDSRYRIEDVSSQTGICVYALVNCEDTDGC
ncbi:MAG: adenylate/guanylate cyclase domain-containing protein [Candidatus Riflebacteria bacterium]|nr:adenylate/guanylate cyclase domain-containing protein [Candidatus Riflebacteria bacterium]